MAEELHVSEAIDKEEKYHSLIPQIKALTGGEPDLIANLANISAALKQGMDFFWVGFYLVKKEELVLGPFQGPIACTRIKKGKGVCGTSWERSSALIVPNVDEFPGHIACTSASKSDIVIPVIKDSEVVAVLDVDSDRFDQFDSTDEKYLTDLCQFVAEKWVD